MAQEHELSQGAYDRLKAELTLLTTEGRIDIARKIETAREMGDLSENGDYHAAKEEQGKMEARIGHLSALLEDCRIIDTTNKDQVSAGHVVAITFDDDDEEERYLVGMIEERRDDCEVVSPSSPLGSALLGAKVGDTVTYETPTGAEMSVTVMGIED